MWYLSQLGRREHYALPSYLHEQGKLGLLATDVWCGLAGSLPRSWLPSKLAQRYNPKLKYARIVSQGIWSAVLNSQSKQSQGLRWVREGRQFGAFAAKEFAKTTLGTGDVVLGYTAANLEQLMLAKKRGAIGLHVQVDPGREWYQTRLAEQQAYPEVEDRAEMPDAAFFDRVQEEWFAAHQVIVHSEHSKRALGQQGVEASRCVVAPPSFEPITGGRTRERKSGQTFRVLFVGNHCLAKGFHYYVQAAKAAPAGMEFHSAGRSMLKEAYHADAEKYVRMHGHLPQGLIFKLMAESDVLVFPTLSDGFGLVQLEAMSLGLPVISTPHCGDVVRDGIDGYKIAARDQILINERLERLMTEPQAHSLMSSQALLRSKDFSESAQYQALKSGTNRIHQ
jgi:glycosyltransferase involved in cell wall biosynthesis